ncbi:hypothetical protein [Actinacidiphila yeochonensis]|uniref:hypothetical protein n=1 Tax=Actinacidiphila yeochonensis TaxID=89050 RepID=UPI0012FF2FCF|nr:hypothetical protein [Actinacidiphila yeochonensis]
MGATETLRVGGGYEVVITTRNSRKGGTSWVCTCGAASPSRDRREGFQVRQDGHAHVTQCPGAQWAAAEAARGIAQPGAGWLVSQ